MKTPWADDLHSRLRAHAAVSPERVALTFLPSSLNTGRVDLTYGDLVERSLRVAGVLSQRFEPGARVLLLLPPTPEFAAAFLGCLAAGVIAVPLPPPLDEGSERRVLGVARDCQPSAIVSMTLVQDLVAAAGTAGQLRDRCEWVLVDAIERAAVPPGSGAARPPSGDDIAFLQYTSGSTSSPRGVMVSHRSLMANEAAIGESFQVSATSTIVSWLPLHHDMGLVGGLLQPLYAGARGVILDTASFVRRPARWLEAISEERADISGGPNFAYDLCTRTVGARTKARLDLRSWRVAFNGAAPVFPRTMRSFGDAFREAGFSPSSHVPCYGLAEATLLVTAAARATPGSGSRSFSAESLEAGVAREARPESVPVRELVAYPLPTHASVRVIDPSTAEPVSDGAAGEIVVAGDSNGSGYWGDRESSAATFGLTLEGDAATYVRTGDLGFILDGELFIQGRRKDVIIHRGRNLHPDDLEADIASCDRAVRAGCGAVFGVPHDGDEAVIVCQEVHHATPPERYAGIVHGIRTTLARIHGVTAHTVALVPPRTVPRTTSGKLQRYRVAQQFLAGALPVLYSHTVERPPVRSTSLADRLAATGHSVGDAGARCPQAALTAALCEHIRDLLDLPTTPAGGESLTTLGADSLTALQVQNEIEEALGIAAPPSMALRAASIADLAAAARAGRAAARGPVSPHVVDTGYELNAAQRALWFLQQVSPRSTAYNITRALRVTGTLDIDRLSAALSRVVDRHASLRIAVLAAGGEPRARVRSPHQVRFEIVDARSWDERAVSSWHRELATTPFDLEHDLLLRAAALRRIDDWVLVLSLHHIVCDGSSLAIIVGELADEYRDGPGPVGPPVTQPGPSPAARERAVLEERGDELAAYWRNELAGEIPRLSLPGAGKGQRSSGASSTFTLDARQTSRLMQIARESGLTLHNLLLSAWQVLLHRLAGQRDILIGVPTSGRSDRRLTNWVGYLVDVVPIRSSFDPVIPFADFARQTQQRVLDALDHQLPLSIVTRLVNPDRDTASSSMFQAMFACYTTGLPAGESAAAVVMGDPHAALSLGSATLHAFPLPDYTTQADVCLNASVRCDTLAFELQSDPERVSLDEIDRITRTFTTLLEALGERPTSAVGRLPLLTPGEVRELVAASSGPRVARPLHYLRSFEDVVARCAERRAADDGATAASYAELDERSNHVAMRLRELGVRVDDNVVVSAARSVDYLAALLGIHKADGCYVPISPSEAPQRAAAMIAAVAPVACIADTVGRPLLTRALQGARPTDPPGLLDLGELTGGRTRRRTSRACPDQGASYVIHTSGSTGPPKPAVSTNAGLTNHLWQMIEYFGLGPEDCVAQTGPVSFDVSVWQLLAPLIVGARVRIVPEPASLSPGGLLDATVQGGVTLLELVPSAAVALLDAGLARSSGALRIVIATGEALNGDVPRRWAREMPALPLYNAYGPCECTDDVSIGLSAWGPDAPTSIAIGRPLTNTSLFIVDDDMQPVPRGVVGWLCVGGAGVGRGYLGNPRRTAEVFTPDPWSDVPGARLYRTGDLGRMTASGDVEFLGRADNQIKIRGLRIEPGEVEAALCGCDGVVEAAAKVEHGPAGDFLVCFVVMAHDGPGDSGEENRPLTRDEDERLRAALVERLPRHMIPSVLVRVSRLPRSANGKTDYRALGYTPPDPSGEDPLDEPDDALSAAVRSIWATYLGRGAVAWHDDFFQLGGHSLLALSMVDRVGQAAGREVAVDVVFACPRLRDFVTAVRRAPGRSPVRAGGPGAFGDRSLPVPASAAQQRFWFLHEMDPGHPTFNMPGVLRMRGVLDASALEAALREVLDRHHVLLSRFSDEGGALTWTPGSAGDFVLRRLDLRGAVAELGEDVFDHLATTEANTPVDLRREVPFRAVLAQLGPADWRLFVSIHHIACDAWSLAVFLRDLADSYNRRARGLPPPSTPARYDFADYCHDELARRERRDGFDPASAWRDVPRRPVRSSPRQARAGSARPPGSGPFSFSIGGDVAAALRDLAGRTGTTPFMVFASALSALVHSGSDDRETILLGTLIAQRDRDEWRRVVGPLLNVSVLAVDLALRDTVPEALRRTKDAALLAYRSSTVPYQEIIGLFEPARGGDGSPFEVLLVMQPEPVEPIDFDGLTTDLVELDAGASPYPLVVDIEPRYGGYQVTHRFAPDRYDAGDIEELAARLEALTRSIVTDSDDTLEDILRRVGTLPVERI